MAKPIQAFSDLVATSVGGRLTGAGKSGKKVAFDPMTISLLFTTLIPAVLDLFKRCREKRQEQLQPIDVQPQVAAAHSSPAAARKQHGDAVRAIKAHLNEGIKAERKRAKATGTPEDIGRYNLDDASVSVLAGHMIASFAKMPPRMAADLCADAMKEPRA